MLTAVAGLISAVAALIGGLIAAGFITGAAIATHRTELQTRLLRYR